MNVPPHNLRVVSLGVGVYPKPKHRLLSLARWYNCLLSVQLLQKTLEINTQSMDQLRDILFKHIATIRISDTFERPEMATDLFEHNPGKLNLLRLRGRESFASHEKNSVNFSSDIRNIMAIPEAQLETWSHQGSITQSKNTYAAIKRCLDDPNTSYAGKRFEVFLQGSYGNDTNIYAESDVDTVIRLDSVYFYDASALQPHELAAFNADFVPATYTYAQLNPKSSLPCRAASASPTSSSAQRPSTSKRTPAAAPLMSSSPRNTSGTIRALPLRYEPGICFFTSSGNRIVNYPKQHAQNCTAKHQSTNQWFKPMVRILKNLRGRLIKTARFAKEARPRIFSKDCSRTSPTTNSAGATRTLSSKPSTGSSKPTAPR